MKKKTTVNISNMDQRSLFFVCLFVLIHDSKWLQKKEHSITKINIGKQIIYPYMYMYWTPCTKLGTIMYIYVFLFLITSICITM